jgi:hypothetical protein
MSACPRRYLGTPVKVWFPDEMRVGPKNKLTYRWARFKSAGDSAKITTQ